MQAIRGQQPLKSAISQPVNPVKPPTPASHRSLQINIDSEEDAKAVIQNLQRIKEAWEFSRLNYQVDSIEFCIAADIRKDVDGILTGAIRWCRTYIKQVTPFDGNILYPLPHYREVAPLDPKILSPAPAANPEAIGKSKRPVRAVEAAV